MKISTHLHIAFLTLAFASCVTMRVDASLQVDLDLDSGSEWALALAAEVGSKTEETSSSSSSSGTHRPEDSPEPRREIKETLVQSELPASATGSGTVVSDGGGAEAPAVGMCSVSNSDHTLAGLVCGRGQWIPDEPIFFLLKVPRLQASQLI